MARPTKEGLDYFSFDVDFFDNKKVRKIMRGCGPTSALILTSLLCNIYQNKGYYTLVDDDLSFDIADKIGVSEGAVKETITKALQVKFFDPLQFEKNQIITSNEILRRYKAGSSKRENVEINDRYTVYSPDNPVSGVDNSINGGDNTQSKVKDSKGNKSKVDTGDKSPTHSIEELELFKKFEEFIKTDAPNVGRMKTPFTIEEFIKLNSAFSRQAIKEMILKMHNYKKLVSNNVSAYLTFINWSKKDFNNIEPVSNQRVSKLSQAISTIENGNS